MKRGPLFGSLKPTELCTAVGGQLQEIYRRSNYRYKEGRYKKCVDGGTKNAWITS